MTLFDPTGDPVWPHFTVDIAVFEVKFNIAVSMITFSMQNSILTSFVFDVKRLEIFDAKMVSMLHFSMFPYSILTPSIISSCCDTLFTHAVKACSLEATTKENIQRHVL